MKKVLVISTSPRKNSNSESLATAFAEGAGEAGHDVKFFSLRGKELQFCRGCFACQKTQRCVIHDTADEIREMALHADVLVFATLLDRLNPLFPSDYAFTDVYFLSSAAEDEEYVPERAVSGMEGWIDCFERAHLAGTVFMGGVTSAGENPEHPALAEARMMGKNC